VVRQLDDRRTASFLQSAAGSTKATRKAGLEWEQTEEAEHAADTQAQVIRFLWRKHACAHSTHTYSPHAHHLTLVTNVTDLHRQPTTLRRHGRTVQWQRFATPGRDDEGGRCANTSRQEDWFDNVEEQDRFVEHASGFAQAPEARTRLVARARRRLWRCGGKEGGREGEGEGDGRGEEGQQVGRERCDGMPLRL
jgi:hypothetical protein